MINLRPYHIQETKSDWLPFFNVYRVNYALLLDSLRYPVIWSLDSVLNAWIPAEVSPDFVTWVKTLPYVFDQYALPKGRLHQLKRAHLIEPEGRKPLDQLRQEMQAYGAVKINQLLSAEYCKDMLKNYYWRNDHLHERWQDLEGIKRTSVNNIPLMRLIHQATEGLVNQLVPEPMKTSYSFMSCYEAGTCLPAHTDRPQCVWNISFMLGSDPEDVDLGTWPLMVESQGQRHTFDIRHGDAVLYSGVRDLHWRDYIPAGINKALGVFLHYVPVDFEGSLD